MKKVPVLCLSVVVAVVLATSASAITVCHDFTWYKISNTDGNRLSRTGLTDQLKKRMPNKYRPIFSFTSNDAAKLAKGQRYLRAGDVVLLGAGNGHSGVMQAGGIEHFIQVPGQVNRERMPNDLPNGPTRDPNANSPPNVMGGKFTGDTLAAMLGRLSDQRPQPVEIWSCINDLKVTITWNTRTDVDLWVEEPNNQKCWYQNRTTTNGGVLLEDVTAGFGPEHYALGRSEPGAYVIKVNYFSGPRNAKVEPTNVTIVVTEGEGTANPRTQTFTKTLNTRGETQTVTTVRFQ